jgi:hypothetical protein
LILNDFTGNELKEGKALKFKTMNDS